MKVALCNLSVYKKIGAKDKQKLTLEKKERPL
jgi:hypothetical protein